MAVTKLNTKEEFTAALNGQGDKLIVVDFTATWCGPCRNIAPKFELMAKDYKEVAVFFKVCGFHSLRSSSLYSPLFIVPLILTYLYSILSLTPHISFSLSSK